MSTLDCRDEDRAFFQRELAAFVPEKVFDAHCHLWPTGLLAESLPSLPSACGAEKYRRLIDWLHPLRRVGALFVPYPDFGPWVDRSNEWTAPECRRNPSDRGLFVVRPKDDPDWVVDQARKARAVGIKCYHSLAGPGPTWELDIPAYLPEPLMAAAHREGWIVLIHLVKSRALADEGNLHWIRHYCRTYPGARVVLAHSARGFQPAHNFGGLPELRDLDNLYFDSSANCEPMAHLAILRILGHKRLMYGSDFPVSHLRGRSVAAADSFLWLYEETPVWGEKHAQVKPVLVGLEHLRSLKWGCWAAGLGDSEIEDVFWNNAAGLLGMQ
jgi:predicted TIM-barrel fold metal-dependent hydrolase